MISETRAGIRVALSILESVVRQLTWFGSINVSAFRNNEIDSARWVTSEIELESELESFMNYETSVVIGVRAASEIELESELEPMIFCDTQYEHFRVFKWDHKYKDFDRNERATLYQ